MREPYSYGDSNGHVHSDGNGDSDRHGHGYRNSHAYGNCHADSNSNADRDAVAAAYTHATASAYTGASSLVLSGIKGTREKQLAGSQLQSCSKSLTTAGRVPYKGIGLHLLGFLKQSTRGRADSRQTMVAASRP